MAYQFLSPEWIEASRAIRAKYADQEAAISTAVKMNQVILDVPGRDGPVHVYLDTTSGRLEMEEGQLDDPDVTITTDWVTARAIFVEQDQAAAMQAFLEGKIRVQGDMMALMAQQVSMPDDEVAAAVATEIQAITE